MNADEFRTLVQYRLESQREVMSAIRASGDVPSGWAYGYVTALNTVLEDIDRMEEIENEA